MKRTSAKKVAPPAEEPAPVVKAPPPRMDREKARVRAVGLIARAAHAGTPEEEARTSALVAAKLIHTEKLLEAARPRHALLDRLDALDDETLNEMAVLLEEALEAGSVARSVEQSVRWRNEAKHLQRKLDTLAGALHWILRGYKLGLAERPGVCGYCGQPLRLGDIIVWKRRRLDGAHYTCCVKMLQQQGAIPS